MRPFVFIGTLLLLSFSAFSADKPSNTTNDQAEIELARSAAPHQISDNASVYVFKNGEYVLSEKGTNGFSCLVLRDDDPRSLYPACLDPEWTRCTLPEYMKDAELRHQGMAEDKIESELDRMRRDGKFPAPTKSGIAYMASSKMRGMFPIVKDGLIQPHVMIYALGATNQQIGVKNVGEARKLHIPFVASEGRSDAHILSPVMTYTDGTRFPESQ